MDIEKFVADHRVAQFATVSAEGQPHVVPVVYAYDGDHLYIPLDEKPKSVSPMKLQRVRNIRTNSRVSVLVDDYDEDWDKLAWVRVDGVAAMIFEGQSHKHAIELLRAKYPQYRQMKIESSPVIQITIRNKTHWEAAGA